MTIIELIERLQEEKDPSLKVVVNCEDNFTIETDTVITGAKVLYIDSKGR